MKNKFAYLVLLYIKIFAKLALIIHKPYVIGIAGSAGKSSTRNAIFSIVKSEYKTLLVSGNSESGVPLGILGIEIKNFSILGWIKALTAAPFKIFSTRVYSHMIVEMGIDDPNPPKNMEYLLSIVKPDLSICLNISATHTMQFEKLLGKKPQNTSASEFLLDQIALEDTKIITKSDCKIAIFNEDDKYLSKYLNEFTKAKKYTFGSKQSNNISYVSFSSSLKGSAFKFLIDGNALEVNINGYILPEVYREVLSASILTGIALNIDLTKIKNSLETNFKLPRGRSSLFSGIKNSTIIDSSYNSSKNSVISFLDLISTFKTSSKKIVFLMGDMRELGNEAENEHKKVAAKINSVADEAYFVGPLTNQYVVPNIKKGITTKWFPNALDAGTYLADNLSSNSVVLVKGSQNGIYLEEAIKKILLEKKDFKNLCRQDQYWLKTKERIISRMQ